MTGPALYSAEPCGTSDPAPGVRLLRAGEPDGRLSAREALRLAGELIAAGLDSLAAPPLVMPADEFALSRAVWALLEDSGHGDCGGWSHKPGGDVLCTCGGVVAVPEGDAGMTRVYRLAVTYPEGSLERGWEPPGWDPGDYIITSGPDAGALDSEEFRWPAERLCLTPGTAKRRAAIFRKYGAAVTIERSDPVTWPAAGADRGAS